MIADGPIPRFLHGLLEYVAAGLLIAAPFLLDFDSGAATAVAIVTGVGLLFIAATTDGSTSLIDQIPLAVHVVLDYALVALLIAAPFLFGFSDEEEATAFFIGLGVVHLLVTIGTRFRRRPEAGAEPAARAPAGEPAPEPSAPALAVPPGGAPGEPGVQPAEDAPPPAPEGAPPPGGAPPPPDAGDRAR